MTARDQLVGEERVKELMKPIRCWGGGAGALYLDSRDVLKVVTALVAEVRELQTRLELICKFYCDWYDGKHGSSANAADVAYEMVSMIRQTLAAARHKEGA